MLIQIRAQEQQARAAIRSLQAEIAGLNAQIAKMTATQKASSAATLGSAAALGKWGSQMQWAGRQLTYNFTIPLAIAGLAATKFALDNEKSFKRVEKVYGDNSEVFQELSKTELPALERAFEALSNKFGVNRAEVNGLAADWAAAGASGIALAKGVELTLETMILGEMEAADATKALIAIQAQYGISVEELSKAIDTLNMVENQTGATMGDLITSLARSAGTARSAGIDLQHLAAMTAALVPAAGSAANAGNSLKTIISRIMAPTKEAAEMVALFGINVESAAWQSLNGTQRLQAMAEAYGGLADSQKTAVATTLVGRYQLNRVDILMTDMINTNGYYQKALNATSDATKNFEQKQKELRVVLESNPQRLQQMWTILQNAMADVIQPMIPYITYLAMKVAQLAQSFSELDPALIKVILGFLTFIALIGPISKLVGSIGLLFSILARAGMEASAVIGFLVKNLWGLIKLPFSVLATGIGAVLGALSTVATGMVAILGAAVKPVGAAAAGLGRVVGTGLSTGFASALLNVGAGLAAIKFALMRGLLLIGVPLATAAATMMNFIGAGMTRALPALSRAAMFIFGSSGLSGMLMMGFNNLVFATRLGWMKVSASMVTGIQFMTAATSIGSFFSRMNFLFMTFFFTTIPALLSRAWTAIGILTMRGMTAMATIMATMGARLTTIMSAVGAGIGTALSAGYAAAIAITRTAVAAIALLWSRLPVLIFTFFTRIGPIMLGAVSGAWGAIVTFLKVVGPKVIGFMTGPWGIAITIITTLLTVFWNDIKSFFTQVAAGFRRNAEGIAKGFSPLVGFFHKVIDGVIRAFNRLPAGIRNALLSVINMVKTAALAVYSWFSYMNPFQRHSPSLVESVTWGMAIVAKQYEKIAGVSSVFQTAAKHLEDYKRMASSMNFDEWSDQRADVAGIMPQGLGLFDALVDDWRTLNQLSIAQKNNVTAAQIATDSWKKKLDAANASLDVQESILKTLNNELDILNEAYQSHEDAIDKFTSVGITGMKALSDEIFNNSMEQKRLQLAIMDLEDAGGSVDDIRNKMAGLQGDIESLRGEANDLRAAGAGSDVLGPIMDQVDQMESAYDAMNDSLAAPGGISDLQKQLEDLQRQGTRLDLENSLQFDPLLRQIEDLANGMEELPFDDIISGINTERAAMALLNPQIAAAQTAYNAQKTIVDSLTVARDALNTTYQVEQANLQALQTEYETTADAIRDIEAALNDVHAAARSGAGSGGGGGGGGAGDLGLGAAGDFADVGGGAQIGREGGLEDQSSMIDDFTAGIQDEMNKALDAINPLTYVKAWWAKVVDWWNSTVMPAWDSLTSALGDIFGNIDMSGAQEKIEGVGDWFGDLWQTISDGASKLWDLFGPQIIEIWDEIKAAVGPAIDEIKAQLEKFGGSMGPVKEAFGNIGDALLWLWNNVFKPLVAFVAVTLVAAFSAAFSIIGAIIGPVIGFIGDVIGAVIQIFKGLVDFLTGVFTGDWSLAWTGITEIVGGVWTTIVSIFTTAWDIVYGLVQGLVEGIIEWFDWLQDVLVGHSIIPDMVNAIVTWFTTLWTQVTTWVSNLVKDVIAFFVDLYNKVSAKVGEIVGNVVQWFKEMPGKVLAAIGSLANTLVEKGAELVRGIKTGAENVWSEVSGWVGGIAGRVLSAAGDMGSTLKQAGKNLIGGLLNGIKEKFEDAKDFVMGIGPWIADHKGPKAYDLALLRPAGNQIVQGLGNGMAEQFDSLKRDVAAMGPQLANSFQMPDLPIDRLNADMAAATAKMNYANSLNNETVVQHSETKYYNFYGNMEFPNVKDGDSAGEFIRNLDDLAGA